MSEGKISFQDFTHVLSHNTVQHLSCIEIEFCVDNDSEYHSCWLGKTINKETNKVIYWYGLVLNGSQAYDFSTAEEFINAKVFHSKSIKEIWELITLYSIDSCAVDERLPFYLGSESGAIMGPAMPKRDYD